MSEEILRALMQLFAIISKQDDGMTEAKKEYVQRFLTQQLPLDQVEEYYSLYEKSAVDKKKKVSRLTSVGDSVRTLGICRKINKTLTQKQKAVVLVRVFELISSDNNFSDQRMAILDTVAKVFKVSDEEYAFIESFVKQDKIEDLNASNALIITDKEQTDSVIKHLQLEGFEEEINIIKIPSVNLYFLKYNGEAEVMLNGIAIRKRRIYLFAAGSAIKASHGKTIYYTDIVSKFMQEGVEFKLSFQAQHIDYHFKNGNIGLRNINIEEEGGKLVAIMGASGSGKTTLLNVLSGIEIPTSGQVLINNTNLHQESEKLEGVIGFVPQDDLLIEDLTVYQNLYFNAKLCFRDLSEEYLVKLVLKVLDSLGLSKIRDLKVGSTLKKTISGGQRKRLNIGLELIREPAVLFLDEPTSGLSSKDSENVTELLRELGLKGKLIFVVIHQPSSDIYKSFDKILFLDTGGYQIFYGNPVEAVSYFKTIDQQINAEQGECITCGNVNPESIFNIVEAKVVDEFGSITDTRKRIPKRWNEHFVENIKLEKVQTINEVPPKALNIPNKLKQFLVFLKRDVKAKLSNRQYVLINLLQVPLLTFFLSFIIRYTDSKNTQYIFRENENLPAFILMCIVVSLFVGLTVSAEEIFKDRRLRKRESFLHLSKGSYLMSKITLLFTLSAVQTFFLMLIGTLMLGIKGMSVEYWVMLFSISCFANVLGLNISATFNSAVTIYILIPVLIIPQMVLAGAMFSFDKLNRAIGGGHHVPLIAEMMPSRWAYEGLVTAQYTNNKFEQYFYEYDRRLSEFDYKQVHYIPELRHRIESVLKDKLKTDKQEQVNADLSLLYKELKQEHEENKSFSFEVKETQFTQQNFTKEFANIVLKQLDTLDDSYADNFNFISAEREKQMLPLSIIDSSTGKPLLLQLKQNYQNEYLSDLVRNKRLPHSIAEEDGRLVQVSDPIYQVHHSERQQLRYPFFVAKKWFLGKIISTFWYNVIVIWTFTLVFYMMLYFDAFSVLMKGLSSIKSKKSVTPTT